MTEGISSPFNEMTEETRSECIAWLRQEAEAKALRDPVGYFRLQFPDGSDASNEVHEMHRSLAAKMNDERAFLYLRSQRARAEKLAAWEQAVRQAEKAAVQEFKALKKRAQEASVSEIPLSDSKQSAELLAYRRATIAEVTPPEPRTIPKPDVSWNDHDALWIQIQHSGTGVIRHD